MATYLGMLVGGALVVIHLAYCRLRCGHWPNFLRLCASMLAGAGTIPGIQIAMVIWKPPDSAKPESILVDDFRIPLFIGMAAIIALALLAIRDNWLDMHRMRAEKKKSQGPSA
jgi:hypothetical protein